MANNGSPILDKLDFEILSILQEDGRMSFTVIAGRLKISVGTARTRLNKLIEDGTVNIIGRVNPDKVGFRCYAHIAVFCKASYIKRESCAKNCHIT